MSEHFNKIGKFFWLGDVMIYVYEATKRKLPGYDRPCILFVIINKKLETGWLDVYQPGESSTMSIDSAWYKQIKEVCIM